MCIFVFVIIIGDLKFSIFIFLNELGERKLWKRMVEKLGIIGYNYKMIYFVIGKG